MKIEDFMAKIAFLQTFWFEFLGPMYISSYLKKNGHKVELFMDNGKGSSLSEIMDFDPDIIAYSCSTGSHQWTSYISHLIKQKKDILTVMGGPHPTYYSEAIHQEGIDFIVRGEGEETLCELVEHLENGTDFHSIPNLVYLEDNEMVINPLRGLINDLDLLPSPDRELYYKYHFLRTSPNKHVITGRGCPYNCSFCCNKAYKEMYHGKGKVIRRHSIDRVINDIVNLRDRYGLSSVRFDDEVFILSPQWLFPFLEAYAEKVHIPFSCLIRADILTEEITKAMKKAGCYIAYFGIESGNNILRNSILKKRIARDDIIKTAKLLRKYNIKSGTFNMLGLPGETIENAFETVTLNREINADYPWCSILQPYPKTELEEEAIKNGYIEKREHISSFSRSYFNHSVIKNKAAHQLENLQKFFYIAVKYPFLDNIIRNLIKWKPNIIFDFIFQITYTYRYIKTYRISLIRIATYAFKMKGHF